MYRIAAACAWLLLPALAAAQGTPPTAHEPKVSVSGYVQPQYERLTFEGNTTDRTRLRRAVLTVEADLGPAWNAELQIDAGPPASSGDRLLVKDALLQYTGWAARGVTLSVGNLKLPFSQSNLQSSSRRSLVERPFTGDGAFGAPGRAIAVRADGWHRRRTFRWSAAVASSRHSPDPEAIGLDGIAQSEPDWPQGPAVVGRVELHPFGEVARQQGDFEDGPLRLVLGAGAFRWSNDDDVLPGTGDVAAHHISGLEISGGLRRARLSMDAEYQRISARALDARASVGLYTSGEAILDKGSIEAGYMLLPSRLEAVTAVDALEAPAFETPWRRAALGMNWYVNRHALKFSLMHRESFHHAGVRDARSRATYLQSHFAF